MHDTCQPRGIRQPKHEAYLNLGIANVCPDSVMKSADCPTNSGPVTETSAEADRVGDDAGGSEAQPPGGVYTEREGMGEHRTGAKL